ncbi:MAG: acyltransferase family protein, partial [Acidobacteria bacterium]|nr:acyltransferase family protein [Acidobacteriota bacterium]
ALFELDSHGPRIHPLEGLRTIGALLVFLVHFHTLLGPYCAAPWTRNSLAILGGAGNGGVDLFFAISGYLIYRQFMTQPFSWRRVLRRRVVRLYPAFLTVYLFYVIQRSATHQLPGPGSLLASLLMLPGIVPLPLLFLLLRLPAWPGHRRAALLLGGFNTAQSFIWGADIAPIHYSSVLTALFLGILFLGYFALSSRGPLQRALSWAPLRYFGNMSYSYYLLHGSVLYGISRILPRLGVPPELGPAAIVALALAAFALTLPPTAALFLLVERPLAWKPSLPSAPRQ